MSLLCDYKDTNDLTLRPGSTVFCSIGSNSYCSPLFRRPCEVFQGFYHDVNGRRIFVVDGVLNEGEGNSFAGKFQTRSQLVC